MRAFLLLTISFLTVVGCTHNDENESAITDPHTTPELEPVDQEDDMVVVEYQNDNMERGDNPYNYLGRSLIIDPLHEDIQRGEVIYYERPDSYYDYLEERKEGFLQPIPEHIARVIALPGETIKIKDGQIYIDDKELDTFYGDVTQNPRSSDADGEFNLDAVQVPEDHVFVLGDLLWRSIDSKQYGPIQVDNIIGKIQGYQK
ncbi:signal peptidase I [Alkalibacillus haloalkaliphilus]|uniref:Signal peptidase I n=1 Tax=Alkalibacillus haloalkaliphilus TaxID=94136 RepID=A0A511W878_9BACI|nr:signal peptidase I [Alkalibacillus haloalkaliphilus]GEN45592.1 hypothetical protein AHA02nite_13680 [Alkalibacillus haloalkaliphilus]